MEQTVGRARTCLAATALALSVAACSDSGGNAEQGSTSTSPSATSSGTVSSIGTSTSGEAATTDGSTGGATQTQTQTAGPTDSTATATSAGGGVTTSAATSTSSSQGTAGGVGGATSNSTASTVTGAGAVGGGGQSGNSSPGCGASEAPESGTLTIDVSGTEREYILELPENYDPSHPYRLIFAWHGLMYSAEWVASGGAPQTGPYYGLLDEADETAVFVAPQALSGGWSNQNGRDIAFLDAMLESVQQRVCIDQGRIFSVGFSYGAIMTINIACERADSFRAVAPMSGRLGDSCPDADVPLAYWGSHGDADTTILPSEGEAVRDSFVQRNGCSSDTTATEQEGCVSYADCDPNNPVTWCVFSGVHEPAPFAGPEIWKFLAQF